MEHLFVGHPAGSHHVSWNDGPHWEVNPEFVPAVRKLSGHGIDRPIVLICRSGNRSAAAAQALEAGASARSMWSATASRVTWMGRGIATRSTAGGMPACRGSSVSRRLWRR